MTRIEGPIIEEPIPEPTGIFERLDEQEADYEFVIKKTATVETVTTATYELSFLHEQRAAIVRQLDEQVSARNKELAEVDELIAEAEKLGITIRPKEVSDEPVQV